MQILFHYFTLLYALPTELRICWLYPQQRRKIFSKRGYSGYDTKFHLVMRFWCHYLPVYSDRSPVGWGCRIHQLHFCKGLIPPPNRCPGYDIKQSDGKTPALGDLGNVKYPFIAIAPRSTLTRSVSSWKGPVYGSNRTKYANKWQMLNCDCYIAILETI